MSRGLQLGHCCPDNSFLYKNKYTSQQSEIWLYIYPKAVRFDSKEGILLWGLGLNSELCLLLHLPLLGLKKIY